MVQALGGETAAAKRLGAEEGILVREAERRLDANLFLDEIPRWEPSGPHHPYLYQRMFTHVEPAGWKEYNCWVHWGHQQPSPERDVQVEVPTMELITHKTTQEEIMGLYHQVYQLKRNPREVSYSQDTTEEIHIGIMETLKECLWHRQSPALLEEEWRQTTTSIRTTRTPCASRIPCQSTHDLWSPQKSASGYMPGGLGSCMGCPPPGIGSSCLVRKPYRKIEWLHLLWVAW